MFEANLLGTFYDSPRRENRQRVTRTDGSSYHALTKPTEKYHAPSFDLYYRAWLPKKQQLTFNAVGTYVDTRYGYSYQTFADDTEISPLSSYGYATDGDKYSFIGEGRYYKSFSSAIGLQAGVKNTESRVKNRYTGSNEVSDRMNTSTTYAYAQAMGKVVGINYSASVAVDYRHYSQDGQKDEFWTFHPTLNLSYAPVKGLNIRYYFSLSPYHPTLSNLSDVRQQADDYEYYVGNPLLTSYRSVLDRLTLTYASERVYFENVTTYRHDRHPILPSITRLAGSGSGGNYWETSFVNGRSASLLSDRLAGMVYIIPGVLDVQGLFLYKNYRNECAGYSHSYHNFSGGVQADLFLGKWEFGLMWSSREGSLEGETIQYRQSNSEMRAYYTVKQFQFGLSWSYLFKKDRLVDDIRLIDETHTQRLKVWAPSYGNMVSLSVTWNFNKGRSYKSPSKSINNSDDSSDNGILKM